MAAITLEPGGHNPWQPGYRDPYFDVFRAAACRAKYL